MGRTIDIEWLKNQATGSQSLHRISKIVRLQDRILNNSILIIYDGVSCESLLKRTQ
jgi:hypothetical protein